MSKKANISIFVPHNGCPQQCSFCNQKTITGKAFQPSEADVANAVQTALKQSDYVYEIAFFGGSFTAIEPNYMESLLKTASAFVDNKRITGIRVSTRPDFINPQILDVLKKYHVTSIELGAQSMDDEVLKLNMRGHTSQQVENAARLIKSYGFELGLQMMTGLYGDTDEKAISTAEKIISLSPKTVRIYPTVVLKGTYLAELYEKNIYSPQNVQDAAKLCAVLLKMFEDANIRVIRVGLHSSPDIKENAVAGAFHDSFGEIVKSEVMLSKVLEYPPSDYEIFVNGRSVSQLKGLKKKNIYFLLQKGYNIVVKTDDSVPVGELKIVKNN